MLKNYFVLLSMLTSVKLLNICVETLLHFFFSGYFDEEKV